VRHGVEITNAEFVEFLLGNYGKQNLFVDHLRFEVFTAAYFNIELSGI
jgi:hypothetical protein